jgi:hypothetical protein
MELRSNHSIGDLLNGLALIGRLPMSRISGESCMQIYDAPWRR